MQTQANGGQTTVPRELTIVCVLLVIVAGRLLRLGHIYCSDLPAYTVPYVLIANVMCVITFVAIAAALVLPRLDTGSLVAKLSRFRPRHTSPWLVTTLRMLTVVGPYLVIAGLVADKLYRIYGIRYTGTDGALFSRYAVDLVLAGKNTYAHSMHPAIELGLPRFGGHLMSGNA